MDDMAAAAVANELADGESDPDVKDFLKSQDPSSSTDDAVLAYKFQLSEGYRVCWVFLRCSYYIECKVIF